MAVVREMRAHDFGMDLKLKLACNTYSVIPGEPRSGEGRGPMTWLGVYRTSGSLAVQSIRNML